MTLCSETVHLRLGSTREHAVVQVCFLDFKDFVQSIIRIPITLDYRTRKNLMFSHPDFTSTFLSQEELDQVNGFRSLKKQVEWMAGRYIVRKMVAAFIDPDHTPSHTLIEYRDKGAPWLKPYPRVKLSITHSGDYAAAAVCLAESIDIGLDLEQVGERPDPMFMKTAFTRQEIDSMGDNPPVAEIIRQWTVKEAFLKYLQQGFHENLHRVEILDSAIRFHGRKAPAVWKTRTIGADHIMTLLAGPPRT
ncbi:MAG: 4'-phosphopantetheinyl transferase superfamily protein [Pseudomonadota bacterium]